MPSHYDVLPDLAFGHHPVYGIVAANPKNLAASTWMLKGFDFHPVPDQPTLYALAHQERDGHGRTSRAVELLRASGYRVDVDAALDPSLAPDAAPARDQGPLGEPDVAFAEHPQLGVVAAIDDRASGLTGLALVEYGWRHNPILDVYTLPVTTGRDEALGKVAGALGDPITAAADGLVKYSGNGVRGLGNLIIVEHQNGFITAYAHNRAVLVKTGQTVKRGAKIAELGQSDTTSPRLHFEIRRQGTPVDPMQYLPPK